MANGRLSIGPVVDRATVERMHEAACETLSRTGILVEHAEIREQVLRRPGFRQSDGRVLIEPARVRAWLEAYHRRNAARPAPAEPDRVCLHAADLQTWVVERDHKTVRPMTRADVIDGTKLIHMLGPRGVYPSTVGVPMDIPIFLRPLEQFMIAAEYSGGGGSTSQATSVPLAEVVREMNRVYGRDLYQSCWCHSTLRLAGPEVEIVWRFRTETKGVTVGTMPTMGITGPCDPIALCTLSLAECIGGAVVLDAVLPGVPVGIFIHPEPADMHSGLMVCGSPEWELLDLMHRDVMSFYGIHLTAKLIHTSASIPNVQAQAERATGSLLGALGGYTNFGPIGQLSIDEIWCSAQAILDLDIVAHALRVARGAESAPELQLDRLPAVIDEVVRGGMLFAEHESTVRNMRYQYHRPDVLQRTTRRMWTEAGMPQVLDEAQKRADELVASYDYQPPQDILRELQRIYEKGRQRLC